MKKRLFALATVLTVIGTAIVGGCGTATTSDTNDTSAVSDKADETEAPAASEASDVTESGEISDTAVDPKEQENAFSLWSDGALAPKKLEAYVKSVTDESSADFIPVEDRIAVFDLDGTLICETDPNYLEYELLAYRVLEDEDYRDKASSFEKEIAKKIKDEDETGETIEGLEVDSAKAIATAFKGMTIDEVDAYVQEYKKQAMPSYEGMTIGESFYRPMVDIVDYLQANEFTTYIVSGTNRFIVRSIIKDSPVNIPTDRVIGTDVTLTATNQGKTDGAEYVFTDEDDVVIGGKFVVENIKMNKVLGIVREIGRKPVLSFGNSTGDTSMAEYVVDDNPYKSLAFMICCDDQEREDGKAEKAENMYKLCEEFGWIPISMKNDWTTIYGEGVTHK